MSGLIVLPRWLFLSIYKILLSVLLNYPHLELRNSLFVWQLANVLVVVHGLGNLIGHGNVGLTVVLLAV